MTEKQSFTTRLGEWVDGLPKAIRPAVFGALIIVMFMMMRGAWLVAPIAIVYVLATSPTPAADLALIRLLDGKPFWTALPTEDLVIASLMTVMFGLVMGHSWFGPDRAAQAERKRPA